MSAAKVILDTNIVSYLMKGGPLAELYAPHVQGRLLAISFITVGELYITETHLNQLHHRMDPIHLEPGYRVHQNKRRVRQLLCRAHGRAAKGHGSEKLFRGFLKM